MKKILLLILIGIFFTTGTLTAKGLGKGKMKASISVGYTVATFKDDVKMSKVDLGQEMGFAALSPQAAGLGFFYGLTKDLDLMYSMPLYSIKLISTQKKDINVTRALGTPLLGITYHKKIGKLGLKIAPYIGVPFIEMLGKTVTSKGKDKEIDLGESNFNQPILGGLTMAVVSKKKSKIFWQAWVNTQFSFMGKSYDSKTKKYTDLDPKLTGILTGLIGYKPVKGAITKIQLFWIIPDLLAEKKEKDGKNITPGFLDGALKIKTVFGKKINKTSGIHAGVWTKLGFTELSKKSTLGESTFAGGITFDYWIKF